MIFLFFRPQEREGGGQGWKTSADDALQYVLRAHVCVLVCKYVGMLPKPNQRPRYHHQIVSNGDDDVEYS